MLIMQKVHYKTKLYAHIYNTNDVFIVNITEQSERFSEFYFKVCQGTHNLFSKLICLAEKNGTSHSSSITSTVIIIIITVIK